MKFSALLKQAVLGLTVLVSFTTMPAAHAVPIIWNGWTFDYQVGVNNEGLALKNVIYQTHTLLKKISLPVIRDDYYSNVCGPFSDQLGGDFLPMPWANNASLSHRQFTHEDGRLWYEIGIRKQVNNKEYFQAYYLSKDGLFDAHLYSRGYQCSPIHNLQPNWRIDLDVDGSANDLLEFNKTGVYQSYTSEFDHSKGSYVMDDGGEPLLGTKYIDVWRVRDTVTNNHVYMLPGYYFPHPDGSAPGSANTGLTHFIINKSGLFYKSNEDIGWTAGTSPYVPNVNGENIYNSDVVTWLQPTSMFLYYQSANYGGWDSSGISLVPSWTNPLPDVVATRVSYSNGFFTADLRNIGKVPTPKTLGIGFYVDGIYRTWASSVREIMPGEDTFVMSGIPDRYVIPDGNHKITAWLDDINRFAELDKSNNQISSWISLTGYDTTAPYVAVTSPIMDSTVAGPSVTVSAKAYDNVAVTGVQFEVFLDQIGHVNLGALDTTPPYTITWDSTSVRQSSGAIAARAFDAAGNSMVDTVYFNIAASTNQLPDISVTALSYANGRFACTIKNVGASTIPSKAWMGLGYFVDGIEKTWTSTYGPLAPGASITLGTLGASYAIPSGTHTIKVIADDQFNIMEANETNNTLSQTITIP